ncbi:MAG: lipoyl(octanoyl) transferase LipB [Bacteroidales bacterium]|nr:lipoyl(octanoyl) transferase LipB [Bacteroidales bacterium]
MKVIFEDLGNVDYKEAWDYQELVHKSIVETKESFQNNQKLLFCEHPHVYTLGKSGKETNLLINPDFLTSIGATYYKINRGGDITYHGPGQIVGYPIIDLERLKIGVKEYIFKLEESIIQLLKNYGIQGSRFEKSTGVWLDTQNPEKARKICAIGVRVSKYVTMHGFALNVNTDLNYFNYINPCGFIDRGVTSMAKELNAPVDFQKVKEELKSVIYHVFQFE